MVLSFLFVESCQLVLCSFELVSTAGFLSMSLLQQPHYSYIRVKLRVVVFRCLQQALLGMTWPGAEYADMIPLVAKDTSVQASQTKFNP